MCNITNTILTVYGVLDNNKIYTKNKVYNICTFITVKPIKGYFCLLYISINYYKVIRILIKK